MKDIPIHHLCAVFPDLADNDHDEMAASIANDGLLIPIVLYEGKILDGKNRYRACLKAGVKPTFTQYKGDNPHAFVAAVNCKRRHFTVGQRAIIAAQLADLKSGHKSRPEAPPGKSANLRPSSVTHSDAATYMGVSERSVDTASRILDKAPPPMVEKIAKGELSLNAAEKLINKKEAKKEYTYDETGFDLPENMLSLWGRRGEVMAMLREIAEIRNKLFAFQKEKDILYATLNFSDALMALDRAHQEIKLAQLWALCTSCQGHQPHRCSLCKGRGILSKFAWDTFVPEEIKRMRKGRK